MAPVEFEKNIKEKLRGAQIKPSESAWDRLAGRLDESTPARRSRRPWLYAVAACLLVGLVIWFPEQSGNDLPSNTPGFALPGDGDTDNTKPGEQPQMEVPEESLAGTAAAEPVQNSGNPRPKPPAPGQGRATERVVALETQEEPLAPDRETADLDLQIDRQLDTVLAEVALLETRGGGVTDSEIDSLLRRAQERIASDRGQPPRDTVDAMALLSDAEGELDRTFREQLFDKLKTGFVRVRTAVADRNN